MKKYWKLITLVTVVVLTIGTMYVGSAIEASKYPIFVIEHEQGNEAEVEQVMIDGQYEVGDDFISTRITAEGTTYHEPSSYIDNMLQEPHLPAEMKHLQKEYYSFMRGKDEELNKYFEDQNYLVYVTINNDYYAYSKGHESKREFIIDVLDKQTNKTASFDVPIALGEQHDYINLQKIQLLNDQLKIFTVNDYVTDVEQTGENEIHLYSVDIEKGKLISDDVIDFQAEYEGEDQYISIYAIGNGGKAEPSKYIIYAIDVNADTNNDDELLERQLIAYNLETNKQEKIVLPEAYDEETHPLALSNSTLYFINESVDNIEVIGYDLDKDQIETKQTFAIPEMEEGLTGSYMFENDKLYMAHPLEVGKVDSNITIGDPKSGEILYEGSIKLAPSNKDEKINRFYIYGLDITRE